MTLAFLDTTVINRCHKLGMTGSQFRELLGMQELEPVLGFHTTYELARDFLNSDPARTVNLFCIIRDLKPKIVCKRADVYIMEFNHLKLNSYIEPLLLKKNWMLLTNVSRIIVMATLVKKHLLKKGRLFGIQ